MKVAALLGVSNIVAGSILAGIIAGTAAISPLTAARILQYLARFGWSNTVLY